METAITDGRYNEKVERNEKNKIKLFLESCLRKKVEKESIKLLNVDKKFIDTQRNEAYFKVWLYTNDVINYVTNILPRNNDYTANKMNQELKLIRFNLGKINFEELKNANYQYNSKKSDKEPNRYYVVLAHVYLSKVHSQVLDEVGDIEKAIEIIQNYKSAEKVDTFYFHKTNSNQYYYGTNQFEHCFITKNPERVVYQALVSFTTDETDISCSGCSKSYEDAIVKYCHNDKKYFCVSCDDDYHNKSNYNVIRKHKRSDYLNFSMTYMDTCPIHPLKPLEFYCCKCNAMYCIKCLTDSEHAGNPEHEIKFMNELYANMDGQIKVFNEKVKSTFVELENDLKELEKSAKEAQVIFQNFESAIFKRKSRIQQTLDTETLSRCTYLASLSIEFQRLVSEIDSKISFIRNQNYNADSATYISMTKQFDKYMSEVMAHNVDILLNTNLDGITKSLHKFVEVDRKDKNERQDRINQRTDRFDIQTKIINKK